MALPATTCSLYDKTLPDHSPITCQFLFCIFPVPGLLSAFCQIQPSTLISSAACTASSDISPISSTTIAVLLFTFSLLLDASSDLCVFSTTHSRDSLPYYAIEIHHIQLCFHFSLSSTWHQGLTNEGILPQSLHQWLHSTKKKCWGQGNIPAVPQAEY